MSALFCEEKAELKDEFTGQTTVCSLPHLWSRALSSDQKNKIAGSSRRKEFPPQVSVLSLCDSSASRGAS